jgi:hypothetical protein
MPDELKPDTGGLGYLKPETGEPTGLIFTIQTSLPSNDPAVQELADALQELAGGDAPVIEHVEPTIPPALTEDAPPRA